MEKRHNLFDAFVTGKSRGKKVIALALAALMVFCFMPALAWQNGDDIAHGLDENTNTVGTVEYYEWELAELKKAYDNLPDDAKTGATGQAAQDEIAKLEGIPEGDDTPAVIGLIEQLKTAVNTSGPALSEEVSTAQAELDKYTEGIVVVDDPAWIEGQKSNGDKSGSTQERAKTITFSLQEGSTGGEYWRSALGFSSPNATQVFNLKEKRTYFYRTSGSILKGTFKIEEGWVDWYTNDVVESTRYSLSLTKIYYDWQQDPTDTKRGLLDAAYAAASFNLDDITNNYVTAKNAANDALNGEYPVGALARQQANNELISALPIQIQEGLDIIETKIEAAKDPYKMQVSIKGTDDFYLQLDREEVYSYTFDMTNTPAEDTDIITTWTAVSSSPDTVEASIDSTGKLTLTPKAKTAVDSSVTVTLTLVVDVDNEDYTVTKQAEPFEISVIVSELALEIDFPGNDAGESESGGESEVDDDFDVEIDITTADYKDQEITFTASGGTEPYTYKITPSTPNTDSVEQSTDTDSVVTPLMNTYRAAPLTSTNSVEPSINTESLEPSISAPSVTVPISTSDSRIEVNNGDGTITVNKDTNTGLYSYDIVITDKNGLQVKTTFTLKVVNDFDTTFYGRRAELEVIQTRINDVVDKLKNLPDGLVSQSDIDNLKNFANIVAPLDALWNKGNPSLSKDALSELTTSLNKIADTFKELGLDSLIDTIDGLTTIMSYISFDKQVFVEGYSYSRLGDVPKATIAVLITGINKGFGTKLPTDKFPSILDLYVDNVLKAVDEIDKEVVTLLDLFDAYTALQSHVVDTNYANLKSVDAVNTYIQELYTYYNTFDTALANFNSNSTFFVGIINGALGSVDDLIGTGLGFAGDTGKSALKDLINSLISQNLGNSSLGIQINDILDDAFDTVSGVITDQTDKLPDDFTLENIVNYSHQLKDGLQSIAGVSALIVATIETGKDFDLAKYDLSQLDMLDDYLLEIYEDYLTHIDAASAEEVAQALRDKIADLRAQLEASPDYQATAKIYTEIVGIYDLVNDAIAYFGSDQPQKDFEAAKTALIKKLETLADAAKKKAKVDIEARLRTLIDELKTAAIEDFRDINSKINQAVDNAFVALAPLIEGLEDAYADAVEAYETAKAAYKKAVDALRKAYGIYKFIEGFDYEGFANGAWDRITDAYGIAAAAIDTAMREIKNPQISASGDAFTTTSGAIGFTTDVDWVFKALQKIGVAKPVYALTSGDSDIGIDGIFTLSKGGALTLNGGVDQYKNGDYGIRVDLIFSADTKFMPHVTDELMKRLNSWFGQLDMTVTVDLPLDRTALSAAITTAEAITTPGSKSQAASDLLQDAIDEANGVYDNATEQTEIDEAAADLAAAIAAFNDSIDIAELAATIATGAALVLGDTKSQAAYDRLQTAINVARAIYEDADNGIVEMVQGDINEAAETLAAAIAAYIAFDNTALTVTIADAAAIQQGAKSLAAFNDLLSAIETARNARGAATQSEINTALSNLRAAIATFYGSPDETVSTVSVDRFALATTLTQATVTVRGNKSAVAFTILQSAIAAANTVFFNANATQEEVDAARLALSNAIIAFNNSADEAIYGGEGEGEGEDGSDDTTPLAAQTPQDSDEPEDTTDGDEPVENIGEVLDPESNEIEPEPEATPPEEEPVVSEIPGQDVPQSSGADVGAGTPGAAAPSESRGTWSLVNLLLGIIAVLLMAWILVRHAIAPGRGKKPAGRLESRYAEKRAPRKTAVLIVGALCSIAVILLFVLTENIQLPMGAANGNTVFYAGAVAIEIAVLAFSSKKVESIYNAKA